jgi:hypothetical protein
VTSSPESRDRKAERRSRFRSNWRWSYEDRQRGSVERGAHGEALPGKAKRDNWLTSGDGSVSLTARKHGDLLEVTFWNNATKKNNVVVFDLTNDGVIGQASHHGFQKAKDAAFRSVTE